jgi:hypothetical protein
VKIRPFTILKALVSGPLLLLLLLLFPFCRILNRCRPPYSPSIWLCASCHSKQPAITSTDVNSRCNLIIAQQRYHIPSYTGCEGGGNEQEMERRINYDTAKARQSSQQYAFCHHGPVGCPGVVHEGARSMNKHCMPGEGCRVPNSAPLHRQLPLMACLNRVVVVDPVAETEVV